MSILDEVFISSFSLLKNSWTNLSEIGDFLELIKSNLDLSLSIIVTLYD